MGVSEHSPVLRACSISRAAPKRRELLMPIYDRFTEGFDTNDLLAATGLLDRLAQVALFWSVSFWRNGAIRATRCQRPQSTHPRRLTDRRAGSVAGDGLAERGRSTSRLQKRQSGRSLRSDCPAGTDPNSSLVRPPSDPGTGHSECGGRRLLCVTGVVQPINAARLMRSFIRTVLQSAIGGQPSFRLYSGMAARHKQPF
jgi:hypothetical protein